MARPYINAINNKDGGKSLIIEGSYSTSFGANDDRADAFAKTIRPAYDAAVIHEGSKTTSISVNLEYQDGSKKAYFLNLGTVGKTGEPVVILKEKGVENPEPIFVNIKTEKAHTKVLDDGNVKEIPESTRLIVGKSTAEKLNLDNAAVNTFTDKNGVEKQDLKVISFYNPSDAVKEAMLKSLSEDKDARIAFKKDGSFYPTSVDEIYGKKPVSAKEQEAPKVDRKDKEQAIDM